MIWEAEEALAKFRLQNKIFFRAKVRVRALTFQDKN